MPSASNVAASARLRSVRAPAVAAGATDAFSVSAWMPMSSSASQRGGVDDDARVQRRAPA